MELLLEYGADPHAVNNKGQCVILASQVLTAATIFSHVHETKHKEHNRNHMEMDKEDAEAQTTPPTTQGTLSSFSSQEICLSYITVFYQIEVSENPVPPLLFEELFPEVNALRERDSAAITSQASDLLHMILDALQLPGDSTNHAPIKELKRHLVPYLRRYGVNMPRITRSVDPSSQKF